MLSLIELSMILPRSAAEYWPLLSVSATTIRKLEDERLTVMPRLRTTSGSWGCTSCSLFCTSTWAISGSMPGPKITEICDRPGDDVEVR